VRVIPGLAVVAVMLVSGCRGGGTVHEELAPRLDEARRQPNASTFSLLNDPSSNRADTVRAGSPSRLTFHVRVPDHAWFRAAVGRGNPEVVDGLIVMIGVSDGSVYRTLQTIDVGLGRPDARPVLVDLREYAGLTVDVVLNVRGGVTGHDSALWVAPAILQR
jgi:hypothetical protein